MPTAKIALVLSVTGVRERLDPSDEDDSFGQPGFKGPLSDRRSYMLPDPHLREAGWAAERQRLVKLRGSRRGPPRPDGRGEFTP